MRTRETSRHGAIIGGDAGGISAASIARRREPDLDIVAFEREPYTSYSACGIPYFVGGVKLIHASPRAATTKGKIERFFRTVRDQFIVTQRSVVPAACSLRAREASELGRIGLVVRAPREMPAVEDPAQTDKGADAVQPRETVQLRGERGPWIERRLQGAASG